VILSGKITGNTESTNSTITNLTVNTSFTCANTCTATFNGQVNFNEAIDFNDNVTIGVLTVSDTGNYSDRLNANNAYIQNLNGEVSAVLKGQITFSPHITNPSSFTCNVESTFNQPCTFNAVPIFSTGVTFNSATINTLTSTNFISVSANITSATINSLTLTNSLTTAGVNAPTFDTDNDGIVITGRIQQIGSTNPNMFQAAIHVAGGINLTSTGQSIDLNNGYVENLQMKPVPDNKDAANVEFVRNELSSTLFSTFLKKAYPIGTIYSNTTNQNNPGSSSGPFGADYFGTWAAFADGRFTVGYKNGDPDFAAVGQIGGKKGHKMTASNLIAHVHTVIEGSQTPTTNGAYTSGDDMTDNIARYVDSGITGQSNPDEIPTLPPYIVVMKWVRTA
jgi:hypothetical protein